MQFSLDTVGGIPDTAGFPRASETMELNLDLLRRLCDAPGAPGREERIRRLVIDVMTPLCDEVSTDALGNVIGLRRSNSFLGKKSPARLMLSGHMDEISFLVTHVDDQGFIRFLPLGGFDSKTLTAQRVIVHGTKDLLGVMGSKPVHLMTEEEKKAAPKLEDFFVDVGLPGADVKSMVSV